MTRQEAIAYIKKNCYGDWCEDKWRDAIDMAIKALSEQQWIPCSEKLPESTNTVIVSVRDESGYTSFDYTSHGWMTTDKEYWIVDDEINNYVVAWMPLPEPYREEGETE